MGRGVGQRATDGGHTWACGRRGVVGVGGRRIAPPAGRAHDRTFEIRTRSDEDAGSREKKMRWNEK